MRPKPYIGPEIYFKMSVVFCWNGHNNGLGGTGGGVGYSTQTKNILYFVVTQKIENLNRS